MNIYKIESYYPNSMMKPHIEYRAHLADALDTAIHQMWSNQYTTISVRTPDCLELVRLWGQTKDLP